MAEIKIIRDGVVVTCDSQRRAGPMCILVKRDRIAEILPEAEVAIARFPEAEVIDAAGRVIFPGFIDAFYQGESFILRHLTSARWGRNPQLRRALAYIHGQADKEQLLLAYRAAYFSALKSGITFLAESGFDNLDLPLEAARAALRRSDLKGMIALRNGDQIENAKRSAVPSIMYACALPAEEELTVYNLQSSLRIAQDQHWPLHVRLGVTRKGHEILKRNFQKSAVQILQEYGLLHHRIHLVHLNNFEGDDLEVLARTGIPVIVGPQAALMGAVPAPPLAQILSAGISLALGTSWGLPDPFGNMRALQLLTNAVGAGPLDPFELLATHTIVGARTLGVDQETGSIEVGKKADLAIVDVEDIRIQHLRRALPLRSSLSTLLEELTPSHVSDVMINGEFFVRRGEIMTYAEEDLRRETNGLIKTVSEKAGEDQEHRIPETGRRRQAQILPLIPTPREEDIAEPEVEHAPEAEPSEEPTTPAGTGAKPANQDEPENLPPKPVELPKNVKRVFGEDDVA